HHGRSRPHSTSTRCSATSRRRPAAPTAEPVSRHRVEDQVRAGPHGRGEGIMRQACRLVLAIFVSPVGVASVLDTAYAQDAGAPGGYQFFVTPYLWLSSV